MKRNYGRSRHLLFGVLTLALLPLGAQMRARGENDKPAAKKDDAKLEGQVPAKALSTAVENDPLVKEYQKKIFMIETIMAEIESRAVQGKDDPTYRAWAARAQQLQAELETWKKLLRPRLAADLRENARKEAARKAAANRPADLDELIKRFGQLNDERFQESHKRMEESRKQMEESRKQMENLMRQMQNRQGLLQDSRLGAKLRKPSATLEEQLDLPNGQGMVLEEVEAKSAAAKAGLKKHDILLELGGKPVSSKEGAFAELLKGIQVGKPVDAVVLRKGLKKTFKGLTLPEAK